MCSSFGTTPGCRRSNSGSNPTRTTHGVVFRDKVVQYFGQRCGRMWWPNNLCCKMFNSAVIREQVEEQLPVSSWSRAWRPPPVTNLWAVWAGRVGHHQKQACEQFEQGVTATTSSQPVSSLSRAWRPPPVTNLWAVWAGRDGHHQKLTCEQFEQGVTATNGN